MAQLEIHYSDDWAALYVDGKLDRVGDTYLTEERAFELTGVKQVQDNAFMRGQSFREGVARTLDEVAEFRDQREANKVKAAELRAEADRLLAEAGALES